MFCWWHQYPHRNSPAWCECQQWQLYWMHKQRCVVSYLSGTNFWGKDKEDSLLCHSFSFPCFVSQPFDYKILSMSSNDVDSRTVIIVRYRGKGGFLTENVSICWNYYLWSDFFGLISYTVVLLGHRQEWKCWSRTTMLVLIFSSLKNHSTLWRPLKLSLSVLPVEGMSLPLLGRCRAERVSASVGRGVPFALCAMVTLQNRLLSLSTVCQLKPIPPSKVTC